MTRKQRLMIELREVRNSMDVFASELGKVVQKKQAAPSSEEHKKLYDWLWEKYFNDDTWGYDINDLLRQAAFRAMNEYEKVIEYMEMKDPIKVVLSKGTPVFSDFSDTSDYQSKSTELWVERKDFEKCKEFFVECPDCGAMVDKFIYECTCGHNFKSPEDVLFVNEYMDGDDNIVRVIHRQFCTDYEMVIDGKTYTAEKRVKVVPVEEIHTEESEGLSDEKR